MRSRLVCFLVAAAGAVAFTGGVTPAEACAQTVPDLPIPTLGPVDATCSRVPDTDVDGVIDYQDNCQRLFNPTQVDTDKDSGPPPYEPVPVTIRDPLTGGDACDTDDDGDKKVDLQDNCTKTPNPDQLDSDGDGIGDACDPSPTAPSAPGPGGGGSTAGPELVIGGLARSYRAAELRSGLAVSARCSAACSLAGILTAGKATLGRGAGGLAGSGTTYVFVRLPAAARKRLTKRRRPLSATVAVTASDDSGRTATQTRRLKLRR